MVATKVRQISSKDLSQAARNSNHDESSDDESSRLIRRAIEQLPCAAKELIVLRYYNNLSYEQIAPILGISTAAINGRLARAKRKMADYLKMKNDFPESRS